jgi:hypothetical protein
MVHCTLLTRSSLLLNLNSKTHLQVAIAAAKSHLMAPTTSLYSPKTASAISGINSKEGFLR